jgi:hypothetical protein
MLTGKEADNLKRELTILQNPKHLCFLAVLLSRIHRIHMFLGLLDPDPDPSIIKQK